MKLALYSIPQIPLGKQNIKDQRLDQIDNLVKAKKKTYVQVELTSQDTVLEADAILVLSGSQQDLILKDLEFVETRLNRSEQEHEKVLLNKLRAFLEKEEFIFNAGLDPEEKQLISGYSLLTNRPIIVVQREELDDLNNLLFRVLRESGFISFFTANEKETRAWLIKKGITAWEVAGVIHSDIQRGFIRAEVISFSDFISAGGETIARQQGKLRLEEKDYVMQDADFVKFRFNR
jgi:ribosome-binding ATPase YchF (GTP1/OBG family)